MTVLGQEVSSHSRAVMPPISFNFTALSKAAPSGGLYAGISGDSDASLLAKSEEEQPVPAEVAAALAKEEETKAKGSP